MSEKKKYRKYFERDKSVNIRITDQDKEILYSVYQHRFLNSDQIAAMIPGRTKHKISIRLNKLFHAGYLDRPRAKERRLAKQPFAYALGNNGAVVLGEKLDIDLSKINWTAKNQTAREAFVNHELMVADFMLAVKLACEKLDGVDFISLEEIINKRPVDLAKKMNGLEWKIKMGQDLPGFKKNFKFSLIPDSAFGLRFHEANKKSKLAFFFVEVDRSTMPIQRNDLTKSSYYKKLVGYFESWRQKLYMANFGFTNPRLLSLTISKERIVSMIAANKKLDPRGNGLRMFLFAPAKTFSLAKPETVFEQKWLNGREEVASLLD